MKNSQLFVGLVGIAAIGIGLVHYNSMLESREIAEIVANLQAASYQQSEHARFREPEVIEGQVATDNIEYSTSPSIELRFTLQAGTTFQKVVYDGLKPDNFGPGCPVRLIGRSRDDAFLATRLYSDCVQESPPEVKDDKGLQELSRALNSAKK